MSKFKTLDAINASGKRVLVRADLNVPAKDGVVTDMTRITRFVPTVEALVKQGGKVIVTSHFGRPKGKKEPSMSLKPIADALSKAMGKPVTFVTDCIGEVAEKAVANMKAGDVIVLENLRYYDEEEANDQAFADKLAKLGDIYVNDAFSCAHRAHASTYSLATRLPAYAGRLMEAELSALNKALENPVRPVVAIVGGSKISTKLDLLNNLVKKIDVLVLGGGMANTFLGAQGVAMGKSLCEADMKDQALQIMATAKANGCKIVLPVDCVEAAEFKAGAASKTVSVNNIGADQMALDIGSASVKQIETELQNAKTLLWNGPLGAFEIEPFDAATTAVAKFAAKLTAEGKITSVAGGGDTVSALVHAGVEEKMTYVSSAGGAFLEWLEGKELPGVAALNQ